jgi:hypothetical protein
LAQPGTERHPAGYVGMIVADSFMKREFGKKLIAGFLPRMDLTHVVATSGAYIPGHGTPTVILFGRNRLPTEDTVRTVMGIKGEPSVPADPARGLVWTAILDQIDRPGSESEFISVGDVPRDILARHPWSIGGGGASDLKEEIEARSEKRLKSVATDIGITAVTGEDDGLLRESRLQFDRLGVRRTYPTVIGDGVRDWFTAESLYALWPYDADLRVVSPSEIPTESRYLWSFRSILSKRKRFGTPMVLRGYRWYEFQELYTGKLATPFTITFAFVATHNHFVLDRGGKVFNRSAPVIKLPAGASEDDHLALLGLLNSSTACIWLKQVFHNKGSTVDAKGARQTTDAFENFYEFTGTGLQQFPLAEPYPTDLARRLDTLAQELSACLPAALCARETPTRPALDAARERALAIRRRMIALQEELDWRCYGVYGLIEEDVCYVPSPQPLSQGARGSVVPSPQPLSQGGRGTLHSPPPPGEGPGVRGRNDTASSRPTCLPTPVSCARDKPMRSPCCGSCSAIGVSADSSFAASIRCPPMCSIFTAMRNAWPLS